jgi:hypothetical protein
MQGAAHQMNPRAVKGNLSGDQYAVSVQAKPLSKAEQKAVWGWVCFAWEQYDDAVQEGHPSPEVLKWHGELERVLNRLEDVWPHVKKKRG